MAKANDTFTEASDVALTSHVADTGQGWTNHSAGTAVTTVNASLDHLIKTGTDISINYIGFTPAHADYKVEANIIRTISAVAISNDAAGVVGRLDTAANTCYKAQYFETAGLWRLSKVVAGVETTLGTDFVQAISNNQAHRVKLEMIGTLISLYVDGIPRIEVTDSSITAAGVGGVTIGTSGSAVHTNVHGLHLDTFNITEIVVVTKTVNSSGGDYASTNAAATAINAGTVSGATTDNYVDINVTQAGANNWTFLLSGANPGGYGRVKLTVDASVRHNGLPGTGFRMAVTSVVTAVITTAITGLSTVVEWVEITIGSTAGRFGAGIDPNATQTAGCANIVRNCIIGRSNGSASGSGAPFRACGIGNPGVSNCGIGNNFAVYDTLVYNIISPSTSNAVGIGLSGNTTVIQDCKNVTIDDVDVIGGVAGVCYGLTSANVANKRIYNTVVTRIGTNTTGGTKANYFNHGASTSASHNASDDATVAGSNSLTTIVRGDNYNDAAAYDFRPVNDSAPIFGSGIDLIDNPVGLRFDLRGRDRDAQADLWSRGAYQLSAGGSVTPAIVITAPVAFAIKQQASGVASIAASGTYQAGPPTGIEYSINNGAWTDLGATIGGGTWSGTIASVPSGTNTLSFRWANNTGVTASVSNILVGTVYCGCGQSNESNRLTNQQSYTHASQKASVIDQDDLTWRELTAAATDPESSGGSYHALLATQHLADRTEPCGFITTANGGQTISQWFTTSAQSSWTSAKGRITASGTTPAAFLIDIGESDALASTTQNTFQTYLANWIADIKSLYPTAKIFIALTGTVGGAVVAADLDNIRKAQLAVIDPSSGVYLSRCGHDRSGLHWTTDAEGLTQAIRTYLPYQFAFSGGSNHRGPRIQSATVNGSRNAVTIVFDRVLKTGLTHATGPWAVSDNGTPATVSSVSYHGSNTSALVLNLSGTLAGASGTCTVTFASGDTAAGVVIPKSEDISIPVGTAVQLPAEPAYAVVAGETDAVAPTVSSKTINAAGTSLTVGFSEAVTGSTGFTLTATGGVASLTYASGSGTSSLVFTIGRTIGSTETATLAYSAGNIADNSSNALASFSGSSVTNNSTQDLIVPTLSTASINSAGSTLTLGFSENASNHTGFSLSATGGAVSLTYSSGDGGTSKVFNLSRTIGSTETVTLSYTPGNVTDGSGNALASISSRAVTNNSTQDTVAPTLSGSAVDSSGTALTLTFSETVTGHSGFSLTVNGAAASLTYSSGDGSTSKAFSISQTIEAGQTVLLSYIPGNVVDGASNALAGFSDAAVTNGSAQGLAPPTLVSAVLASDGRTLTLTFDRAAFNHSGFGLASTTGVKTLTYSSGDGTTAKVFTVSRTVGSTESVVVSYTPGNVASANGVAMAAFSETVTNNSTQTTAGSTQTFVARLDPTPPPSPSDVILKISGTIAYQNGVSLVLTSVDHKGIVVSLGNEAAGDLVDPVLDMLSALGVTNVSISSQTTGRTPRSIVAELSGRVTNSNGSADFAAVYETATGARVVSGAGVWPTAVATEKASLETALSAIFDSVSIP